MRKAILVIILATLVVGTVSATTINLLQNKETIIGVTLEDMYYVVKIEEGELISVLRDSEEKTDYQIETNWTTVMDFATKYSSMSKLERLQYVTNNFNIPEELIMQIAGNYIQTIGR